MKPDTKVVVEDFVLKNHCSVLIGYFEKNKHLCWDRSKFHAHRNLPYNTIKNKIIRSVLKYYVTKTCFFIDHYFKDKVGPWDEPRICRWTKGETMGLHTDRTKVDKMKYSSLIYLTDDYEGGKLKFVNGETFKFKAGTNVFFRSDAYNAHQVLEITKGHRYTIPTWYTTRLTFITL